MMNLRQISDNERIKGFIDSIARVANGNYTVQLELSGENNMLDALAMGLNMMIDELRNSLVVSHQNDQISKISAELKIAREKAEESERLKTAFLANMSHEIRTPMNGILGFAALLKKPELTGEQQKKYITVIEKSGERMLNIINELIEISRIESGQTAVSLAPTNINEQFEFVYLYYRHEVERKGIKLNYQCGLPTEQALVSTDRDKIYTVLMNMVKNAIKYSHEGTIDFGYEKKGNELEFYVKDTGIGIAQEKLMDVFNRFVQADDSITRQYEGAGLGLSICKAYVEMLGGKIRVESIIGKGSQFYFTIPYVSIAEEAGIIAYKTSIPNLSEKPDKIKLLIAEDDLSNVMLITSMLEEYIGELFHVATSVEAIETMMKVPDIDLVLLDIKMPKMGGFEAVREIRKFNKEVVIIAQTGYSILGEREKALEAGCNDYISKPINTEILLDIVNNQQKKKCFSSKANNSNQFF
jgi:hypothetical protein